MNMAKLSVGIGLAGSFANGVLAACPFDHERVGNRYRAGIESLWAFRKPVFS